jgi:hypothetical protein
MYSFGGLFRDMLRLQGTGDDYDDRYIWSFNPPDTIQLCALNRRSSRVPFRKIRFLVNNWTLRGRTDTVYNIYSTCIYNQMPDFMAVVTSDRRYGVDSMTYTRDANGINRHLTFSTSDNMGISGQNSKNPESAFSLHYGAKLGNKYYDPSYGVIYNNINDVYQYLSGWMYLDPRYVLLKEEALRKDLNLNGRIDDYYTYSLYHIGGVNAFLPFFR